MRIEVLDDAKNDLVDGFHFYEEQSPGLGSYFLDFPFLRSGFGAACAAEATDQAMLQIKTCPRLLALVLAAFLPLASWAANEPVHALQWVSNAVAKGWALNVTGTDAKTLAALRNADWTPAQWQKLLAVHAESGDALGSIGMPAMLGAYRIRESVIQFAPQFPLEPGLRYVAAFDPAQLPGAVGGQFVSTTFELPRRATNATTVVAQVYPTAAVLPENLLKFYVHFSAPMSRGRIYEHIHLRNAAGKDVSLPFLEIDQELWDPQMTRLTLFIDPGRIKRGVTPLEEIGPALEEGKGFTLVIDRDWTDAHGRPLKESFQKHFTVGPPDRTAIDPSAWQIQPPAAGTRAPLTVTFPKPLDHALAQRMLHIADRTTGVVEGTSALENEERRWTFVPTQPWARGEHTLLVQKTIEDLAGNNIGKAFEVDLFEGVQRRFTNATVRLPFEVR